MLAASVAMDPLYSLTGLLVGFLVGMTGMGGGSLMTPLLILLAGVKPTIAIGSDLAYAAVMKAVGAWQHRKAGTVDQALAFRLALGSVPGGLLGVACVRMLEGRFGGAAQQMVARFLGVTLVVVAAVILARCLRLTERFHMPGDCGPRRRSLRWPAAVGAMFGFLVGATSVGSGTFFALALLVLFGLSAQEVVGTDIQHAAILTAALAMANLWIGHVDIGLVANLLLGAIPGVIAGSRLATRLPEKALRPLLAGVLLFSGLRMI